MPRHTSARVWGPSSGASAKRPSRRNRLTAVSAFYAIFFLGSFDQHRGKGKFMQREVKPMDCIKATGLIKIRHRLPRDEAPIEYRRTFEGCNFPCLPCIVRVCDEEGFLVPQDVALEILGPHDQKAVAWWRGQGCGKPGRYFFFSMEEAIILRGVDETSVRDLRELEAGTYRESV